MNVLALLFASALAVTPLAPAAPLYPQLAPAAPLSPQLAPAAPLSPQLAPAAPLQVDFTPATRVSSEDPTAAVFESPERLLVGAGIQLRRLIRDEGGPWRAAATVELPGCAQEIEWTPHGAYVACGSAGLVFADHTLSRVEQLSGPVDSVCTDVAFDGQRVVALYSRADGHVVQSMDPGTGAETTRIERAGGTAHALALSGDDVFVARGNGGVVEHTGALGQSPAATPEIVAQGALLYARDLAVSRGVLWIAGGQSGVMSMRLDGTRKIASRAIVHDDRRRFVTRLSAWSDTLLVGTQSVPATLSDGHPYGHLGPFGIDLSVGGVAESTFAPFPDSDIVVRFLAKQGTGGLRALDTIEVPVGAYRSIDLIGSAWLLQRPGAKLEVRHFDQRATTQWSGPRGISPIDGAALPGTDAVVCGFDTLGGESAGGLAGVGGGPELLDLGAATGHNGQTFDAVWRTGSGDSADTLVVTGGWYSPSILSVAAETRVLLDLPPDDNGAVGHTYIHSRAFGDFVAISRVGATTGLLIYRKSDLEAQAAGGKAAEPVAQATTGAGNSPELWTTCALPSDDGAWLLVSAAGHAGNGDAARPRTLGHHFDGTSLMPAFTHMGRHLGASAVSTAAVSRDGVDIVVVAGLGGTLEVLDVTDPKRVRSIGALRFPKDPWDGTDRALIDVEIAAFDGADTAQLLVACGRAGVARIDLGRRLSASEFELAVDQWIPLAGWTTGIILVPSARTVVACSQKAGAAILREARAEPADPSLERR